MSTSKLFLIADLLLAGGAKLLGEGVVERGKGVGARGVGQGGWGKGVRVRGQGGAIYILMKFSTKQLEH